MDIGRYNGDTVIGFGIIKLPYNEKEIIQKAQYYYSGKRYDDTKGCIFHSGDYYLEIHTKELSNIDIQNFFMQDNRLNRDDVMKIYKYLYVRVVEPK